MYRLWLLFQYCILPMEFPIGSFTVALNSFSKFYQTLTDIYVCKIEFIIKRQNVASD